LARKSFEKAFSEISQKEKMKSKQSKAKNNSAEVLIVMGSLSDRPTMKRAEEILKEFGVSFETQIVSAHRTPELLLETGRNAHTRHKVIIAGAGFAAHLPGMIAAATTLPVIGVPVPLGPLNGQDALYSIVQMPEGIPVATMAIGNSGNAAILAVQILATGESEKASLFAEKLAVYKEHLKVKVAQLVKELNM
jgi:5-(carboxyamino)imidazole ribonucleotide mutase